MTSSTDSGPAATRSNGHRPVAREVPLPGAMASMWRLIELCYRFEPRLMVRSLLLELLAALPRPLIVLWLGWLTYGLVERLPAHVFAATGAMALSVCCTWLLRVVADRTSRRFRDRLAISLEAHVARLNASIETVEHQERPEHLDRLAVLRQQVFMLDHLYTAIVIIAVWLVQLGLVTALLATVDPLLPLLLVFAVPVVLVSVLRPGRQRRIEEEAAPRRRLADHLFTLATTPSAAKDVRLARVGHRVADARSAAWSQWYRPIARARAVSAGWNAAAWALFGLGYALVLAYASLVAELPASGLVLVLSAGIQMSDYVSAAVGELGFLRGVFLHSARRLSWLEDYARAVAAPGRQSPPARITDGITLRGVGFTYPGSAKPVLVDVDLHLPAGGVVAVVGANGAGKSTLVKLLAKFYPPTEGQVLVDGVPLEDVATDRWRDRVTGAFQDFASFELVTRTAVGLGDLPAADADDRVRAAVTRGGADDVVDRLPAGLTTQLGARWPDGVDVSFGQWQKLALSRGSMREDALLVVLDEPTAALDAETEHALFEKFAALSRDTRAGGRITVLVSHRFSTVRMADLIVVLDGNRVVEVGDHESLMRGDGTYAELYRVQERGYQN